MTPRSRFALFCAPVLGVLFGLASACGCTAEVETAPAGILSRFLDAMDRSTANEAALADAYAFLDRGAQHELQARAEQAALLAGRDFEPWQMLAQGRFRLRFGPAEHGGMRVRVTGDSALVHVTSDDRRSQVDVPMVRESGQWRVKLEIPALQRGAPEAAAATP